MKLIAYSLLRRSRLNCIALEFKNYASTVSQKLSEENDSEKDTPVKFSTSGASRWKAMYSRSGIAKREEVPWFQIHAICGSIFILLYYFTMLREESDIDEQLSMSLYDRVQDLEEIQLKLLIRNRHESGLPRCEETEARLEEVVQLRLHREELEKKNSDDAS